MHSVAAVIGCHHTSFTVADLDRSVEFFRDLRQLELLHVREVREDYFCRIVGVPGCIVRAALLRVAGSGHHVELFEYVDPRGTTHSPRPNDPGSTHLSLLVDDLRTLFGELHTRAADRALDVQFVSEPVLITAGPNRGGYGLYLRDPNGILVELFQPPIALAAR